MADDGREVTASLPSDLFSNLDEVADQSGAAIANRSVQESDLSPQWRCGRDR